MSEADEQIKEAIKGFVKPSLEEVVKENIKPADVEKIRVISEIPESLSFDRKTILMIASIIGIFVVFSILNLVYKPSQSPNIINLMNQSINVPATTVLNNVTVPLIPPANVSIDFSPNIIIPNPINLYGTDLNFTFVIVNLTNNNTLSQNTLSFLGGGRYFTSIGNNGYKIFVNQTP